MFSEHVCIAACQYIWWSILHKPSQEVFPITYELFVVAVVECIESTGQTLKRSPNSDVDDVKRPD